ncbi:hypothetical protein LCGC14_2694260, partial [marine sediment metagenome]
MIKLSELIPKVGTVAGFLIFTTWITILMGILALT